MQQENFADIRHKLSVIYKHIQPMHNELWYHKKIHAISEKLSKEKEKKNSASFPLIFLFFIFYVERK